MLIHILLALNDYNPFLNKTLEKHICSMENCAIISNITHKLQLLAKQK